MPFEVENYLNVCIHSTNPVCVKYQFVCYTHKVCDTVLTRICARVCVCYFSFFYLIIKPLLFPQIYSQLDFDGERKKLQPNGIKTKNVDLDLLRPANRRNGKKRKNAEPPHFVEICACESSWNYRHHHHKKTCSFRALLKAATVVHQIQFICFFYAQFDLVLLSILLQN